MIIICDHDGVCICAPKDASLAGLSHPQERELRTPFLVHTELVSGIAAGKI